MATISVFISYRRDDSRHQTGRLFDHMVAHFGSERVFRDIDSIPLGWDFREVLTERVAGCDVLLAIIGDTWISVTGKSGDRRLDDAGDFVRIEIEAALSRKIPVIPVLVGNSSVPKVEELPESLRELHFRNGIQVRPDPDFHNDMDRLILGIENGVSALRARSTPRGPKTQGPGVQKSADKKLSIEPRAGPSSVVKTPRDKSQPSGSHSMVGQLPNRLVEKKASPVPIPTPEPVASPAPLHERHRPPWRLIVAAAVLGFLLLGVIIYVATDKGRIKLVVNDPMAVVKIDGEEVSIEALGAPITLRAGAHALEVKRGDGEFRARTFVVHRGENEALRVEYEPTRNSMVSPKLIANAIGMKLALIPAGEFLMGSGDDAEKALDSEKPRHLVRITQPFYLGVTEVTQRQYRDVTGENPSEFKGSDDLPVENVSWNDAIAFCNKLSEREGLKPYYRSGAGVQSGGDGYRLPTEAEWEYACRAGTSTRFSFGDMAASHFDYAWFRVNSGSKTHPVGEKRANAFGLYDMHGNVWEWCWDGYDEVYYRQSPGTDPSGPLQADRRVMRGGSWNYDGSGARAAYRYSGEPTHRYIDVGFRCARVQSGR